jgi:GT2 family glycosyltransferase
MNGSLPATRMLGVVVLVYGSGADHTRLLSSILAEGVPATNVVIVHNPRSLDEPDLLSPRPGVCIVRASENRAYTGGMNLGVRHHLDRGASDIMLLTEDVRLRPRAIRLLLAASGRAPAYGILGPSIWLRGQGRPFSFGGTAGRGGVVGHRDSRPDAGPDGIAGCDWIDGAIMLIRSEVFREVGLLDERFFMYFEETELCLRAAKAGWRIGVVLGAVAEQSPGGSQRPGSYQYLCTRNGLAYAWRASGAGGLALACGRRVLECIDLLRAGLNPRVSPRVRTLARLELTATWSGVVDFLLRRWGPPPSTLAGLGDMQAE